MACSQYGDILKTADINSGESPWSREDMSVAGVDPMAVGCSNTVLPKEHHCNR